MREAEQRVQNPTSAQARCPSSSARLPESAPVRVVHHQLTFGLVAAGADDGAGGDDHARADHPAFVDRTLEVLVRIHRALCVCVAAILGISSAEAQRAHARGAGAQPVPRSRMVVNPASIVFLAYMAARSVRCGTDSRVTCEPPWHAQKQRQDRRSRRQRSRAGGVAQSRSYLVTPLDDVVRAQEEVGVRVDEARHHKLVGQVDVQVGVDLARRHVERGHVRDHAVDDRHQLVGTHGARARLKQRPAQHRHDILHESKSDEARGEPGSRGRSQRGRREGERLRTSERERERERKRE